MQPQTPAITSTPQAGNGEPVIMGLILTPFGIVAATCAVPPLRRCLSLALARPVAVFASTDGIIFTAPVRNPQEDADTIRAELAALRYLEVAHVGLFSPDGWKYIHGSPDLVEGFENRLRECAFQAENSGKILLAHVNAASLKT